MNEAASLQILIGGGPVLLYDGVCNLCHGSVRFVLNHERASELRFCALQSEEGQVICNHFGISSSMDSLVLIEDGTAYSWSTAALRTSAYLRAPWAWARFLLIIPRSIRDVMYGFIARNRYMLFGKKDYCTIPTRADQLRFIDVSNDHLS